MTSSDGISWTSRTSAADSTWSSITYGNGLFVAVASGGTMTSPDGIVWSSITSIAGLWQSITYGNGLFVAVGSSGIVMTSPDGSTWTARTGAASNDWQSITYGNGLFVAISSTGTGNRVMTSSNGINWILGASAADNEWFSITYGNGTFTAISHGLEGVSTEVMTGNTVSLGGLSNQNLASIVSSGSDPTQTGTIRSQSYQTINSFTNDKADLADGEFGLWDFLLDFTYAQPSTTYCIRAVKSDGNQLDTYTAIPKITTGAVNVAPATPTLSTPTSGATGISNAPTFTMISTDTNGDTLKYKILLYQSDCSTLVATADMTSSTTGWSSTSYASGATASYTYTSSLNYTTTYCWKAAAIDTAGSNTWSSFSATQLFTTAAPSGGSSLRGGASIRGGTTIH
jgi:hypothetical protein